MSEQVESSTLGSDSLSSLADFLADTPEMDPIDEDEAETTDESTADGDTDEPENDEQDDESEGEPDDKEPIPVAKITVKVKGADGTEESLELTHDEIASSYMRQSDYTRKTTELATRESQAVDFLKTKHDELRSNYLSQAELARAAVAQMAGIKSEDEMASLAHSDPAAWVQEQQRQRQISAFLGGLDQQINGEKQRAAQESDQVSQKQRAQAYEKAWSELQKDGIDKVKLAKIYTDSAKHYGFSEGEFSNLYDHRFVRALKDATAYRELQAQKSVVTKKALDAPRMPTRQANPAQERKTQELNNRFKGGRAKLSDLAAYLNS